MSMRNHNFSSAHYIYVCAKLEKKIKNYTLASTKIIMEPRLYKNLLEYAHQYVDKDGHKIN